MPLFEFEGKVPVVDETAYVFPTAVVIGNVKIGREVWVGPGAVLRGDYGEIEVGDFTAVEDNVVIHARPGEKTTIGKHVTLGHMSVIHTPIIGDWAVIGMNSTISDFAKVGTWAAVAEGAVVRNRSEIPEEGIAAGVPAKVIGKVTEEYKKLWEDYKNNYNTFCRRYRDNLAPVKK